LNSSEYRQYYNLTQGLCNHCGRLVPAKVFFSAGKVYMDKLCNDCGPSRALIFSDASRYKGLTHFVTGGKPALHNNTSISKGCPDDCGLCPSHSQHTCLPIIEITDKCNLNCPICLAENASSWEMSIQAFQDIIDNLIRCEGTVDIINLSGGEPTMHSSFREIVRLAARPEFAAVSLSTNGLTLLTNESLPEFLAAQKVFVSLQFDGFSDHVYGVLRGKSLLEEKMLILEKLAEYKIQSSLVVTAAKGINDDQLGKITEYFLGNPLLCSMTIQPLSVVRELPESIAFDPMDRLTVPDIVNLVADGSMGVLEKDDILPLPCSHPACFHIGYLLDLGDGEFIPLNRLFPAEQYLDVVRDRSLFGLDANSLEAVQSLVYQLWSSAGMVPTTEKILNILRNLLREVSRDYSPQKAMQLGAGKIKSIFIHHFMDRYNFDLARANKCCEHYPKTDGRIWPCCVYNNLHRIR